MKKIQFFLYILYFLITIGAGCDTDILTNPGNITGDSITGEITYVGNEPENNGYYAVVLYENWLSGTPNVINVTPQLSGNKYRSTFHYTQLDNNRSYQMGLVFVSGGEVYVLGVYDCGTSPSCLQNPRNISVPSANINFNSYLRKESYLLKYNYWGGMGITQK